MTREDKYRHTKEKPTGCFGSSSRRIRVAASSAAAALEDEAGGREDPLGAL